MMNDERQAQLLEGYLLALRADAGAPPPADLDADLAVFARELALTAAPTPDAAMRDRVWQRALAAADAGRARANGHHLAGRHQENIMIATQRAPVAPKTTQPLTLIAALAVVAVAVLLLFGRPPAEPDDMPALLSNNEQQQETPTPAVSPTQVPTSTPFAMVTIVPVASLLSPTVDAPYLTVPQQNPTAVPGISSEIRVEPIVVTATPLSGIAVTPCIERPLTAENILIPTVESPYLTVPQQNPTVVPGASVETWVEGQPTIIPPMLTVEITPTSSPVPPIAEPPQHSPTIIPGSVSGDPCLELMPTVVPPMMIPTDGDPVAYGDTVEGQFVAGNPVVYYRFEADEGDVITLRVVGENGLDTRLAVSHAAGYFTSDDDSGPGLDPELYRQRLPLSGTYGIAVESASGESGRFTLTLELDE